MSGPIDRYLDELDLNDSSSEVEELRGHLEESAMGFREVGLSQDEAELAAIRSLGGEHLVRSAFGRKSMTWADLVKGDSKILGTCFGLAAFMALFPGVVYAGAFGLVDWSRMDGVSPFIVIWLCVYVGVVLYTTWQATRSKRVGPLAVGAVVVGGLFLGNCLSGLLVSPVPSELGSFSFRWELSSKYADWQEWKSNFYNMGLSGHIGMVAPEDASFSVLKAELWEVTGGRGVFGTILFNLSRWDVMVNGWLVFCFLGGLFGFFSRIMREGWSARRKGPI